MNNRFGIFIYPSIKNTFNLGDYVQGIASKQYLSAENEIVYVDRDKLNNLDQNLSIIFNGWFTHFPENWPPSENVNPLFISFHLNSTAYSILDNSNVIEYLKKHSPIGCRDFSTKKKLEEFGINSYYSGCLTTTLGNTYKNENFNKNKNIYFVDVLFNLDFKERVFGNLKGFVLDGLLRGKLFKLNKKKKILNSIFSKEIIDKAEHLTHIHNDEIEEKDRFKLADEFLCKYSKAKLVVTSRIHVALPCLAMGTPVIFLNGGFTHMMDHTRFNGITHLLNKIDINNNEEFSSNFEINFPIKSSDVIINPEKPFSLIKNLELKVKSFIDENS